ncbi:MAG: EcsC family protein [Mucilaginibacter polytrichastri]|nr:EcsC family protein [Mucilaginibacter polytrichastri]
MDAYHEKAKKELLNWQKRMQKRPSITGKITHGLQVKINSYIPEKVHQAITAAVKNMIRAVLFGAKFTTPKPLKTGSLPLREARIRSKIDSYRKTGAAEGGITGAGGFLMSLADFPILIGIKMKMLFEIAALYGFNTKDYRERIYLLLIFQLAFSSQQRRNEVYKQIADWENQSLLLPEDLNQLDWRSLQQEYRDYIDIAKLAQLLPVIGAAVGAVANYQLVGQLGSTAMQAYRMRLLNEPVKGLLS